MIFQINLYIFWLWSIECLWFNQSPDDLDFFHEYYDDYYTEIVYYEYERPVCPNCGILMNSNGSRVSKPNK